MKHLTIMGLIACAAMFAPSDDAGAAPVETATEELTTSDASTNIEHADTVNVGTDAPETTETDEDAGDSDDDSDDDSGDEDSDED